MRSESYFYWKLEILDKFNNTTSLGWREFEWLQSFVVFITEVSLGVIFIDPLHDVWFHFLWLGLQWSFGLVHVGHAYCCWSNPWLDSVLLQESFLIDFTHCDLETSQFYFRLDLSWLRLAFLFNWWFWFSWRSCLNRWWWFNWWSLYDRRSSLLYLSLFLLSFLLSHDVLTRI